MALNMENNHCDNPEGISEVVEWCPLCEREGLKIRARFFQLNFGEAVFSCSRAQCAFPFTQEFIPFFIKRDIMNMGDPDYTPVVTMADILENGARVAKISTLQKCSADNEPLPEVKAKSKNIAKGVQKYSSNKKGQEQMVDLPNGAEEACAQNMSGFESFVFKCSVPEMTLVQQKQRKYCAFNSRKRRYKKKKTSGTNKSGGNAVGTCSSAEGKEGDYYNNHSSVTNDRSFADAHFVRTEQTSCYNSDTQNGYSERDNSVPNILSIEESTKCCNISLQSDNEPTSDINHDNVCQNNQDVIDNFIELSNGSNCIISFPENVVDVNSNTDCASCDKNTNLDKAMMRYWSAPSDSGTAKNNLCDQKICDVSINRNMLTADIDVGPEDPCGFVTCENFDGTLFTGIESVGQFSQNCYSVSVDNHVVSNGIPPLQEMDDSVERNMIVSNHKPTVLKSDSEIVNFVYSENCEMPSACIKDLQALSEEFMEKGRMGLIGFRYLLALVGLSLPVQYEYEWGHLPGGLSSLSTKISFYKPHMPALVPESSHLQSFTSEDMHRETKGKALSGRNAGRKKFSHLREFTQQPGTSVLIEMASHDMSSKGEESSLHSEQAASVHVEMENSPPALPPVVPSTSSSQLHCVNNDLPEKQDSPSIFKLREKVRLTDKDFPSSGELLISLW